ncbi:glycoside hydrolase family 3 N-terminal domain-containing protein [Hamadaea tsunoensis]|uniref:glycoside hydrolase family 3 N-terminal domain-containing protein n=1 Tax=Hamadaea tsunoensis TaxID=53368 RepID=UPI000428F8B7|nr:glycoside hydrolase family 3 N-terminal domain-containing protein [Hamadaea tsunoensis]
MPPRRRLAALVLLALPVLLTAACNTAPPPTWSLPGTPTSEGASSTPPSEEVSPSAVPPGCTTAGALAGWSLQKLAMQTITVPANEGSVSTASAQVAAGAGGVILFGSKAPASLAASLKTLSAKAPGGIAPFVMTDEEGGTVQRMSNVVGDLPSARKMAATMTPAQIRALALATGRKLKAVGVTMDLAPVLDLDDRSGPSESNPDGSRSFSLDPKKAAAAGIAFAQGLAEAGVVPVVKHYPGLGYASANTDSASATTLPWTTLQKAGLLPFSDAVKAGLPAIMTSNATVPGLTKLPVSLSPEAVTKVLREQLKYDGLVITDSLSATAVNKAGYKVPKAAAQALIAGNDMIMFTAAAGDVATVTRQTADAIVAAVNAGTLTRARLENAVTHVLAAKKVSLCS